MPLVGRDPPLWSPPTPSSTYLKGEPNVILGIPSEVTLAHQETPLAVEGDTASDHYVPQLGVRPANAAASCLR